jgi:hypothetical protein
MALANLLSPFRFYTLAGVQQVRLEADFYKGRWKNSLGRFYGPQPGRLIQEFLNWPNAPESVLLFTRRYGPLRHYARAGEEFGYKLSAWRDGQEQLRNLWRNIREVGLPIPGIHGAMAYESGRLVYWTYTLYSFLQMDLATCPVERLRICLRPNCAQPYFIAHHLGQRYCSQLCAGWVQREWKKKWWAENGSRWRKKYVKSNSRKRK